MPRLRREPAKLKFLLYFFITYLALAGLYTILWFTAPAIAFLFFIVMTWFHWGQGDVYTLVTAIEDTHLRTTWQRGLTLLVRGGLPMLLPLLAFPEVYREVAHLLIQIFGPVEAASLTWAFTPHFRWITGGGFLFITLFNLSSGYYLARTAPQRAAWQMDCFETVVLAFYFSIVPPILAIGLYFCLWHSVRHIIRLILIAPNAEKSLPEISWRQAFRSFIREAASLTVAALLLLTTLYFIVPQTPTDLPGLVALYLVLISALTFPHTLTVCWMDWRQGVWLPEINAESPASSRRVLARW